jgi:hypothetical protein
MSASAVTVHASPWVWLQALALLVVGSALQIHPDAQLYVFALWVFAGVGVTGLLHCVFRAGWATTSYVLMVSLCLGYGLGTLNTEWSYLQGMSHQLSVTNASARSVQRAVGWLMLICSALCVASTLDRNRVLDKVVVSERAVQISLFAMVLMALLALVQVATGGIGYHGENETSSVSPMSALTLHALNPLAALGCFLIKRVSGWRRALMGFALSALMLTQLYQGRRIFIYTLVLCLMCYFVANPPKRLFTVKNLLVLVVTGAAMLGASKAFFALRMATYEVTDKRNVGMLLRKGAEILMNADRAGLGEEVSRNQDSRTFIVSYMATLLEALDDHPPLYGEVAAFNFAMSVPSAMWPGKFKVIRVGAEEGIANPHFGLPMTDEANSVVTAGLSDFGLLGAFIYPMALAALCSALLRATRRLPDAVHLLVAVAMLNTLLNVEGSVADYFNIIRSLAIYLAMGWGAWWALCQVLGLHLMAPKMPRGAGGAQRSQVFMNAGFAWLAKLRRSGKTSAS